MNDSSEDTTQLRADDIGFVEDVSIAESELVDVDEPLDTLTTPDDGAAPVVWWRRVDKVVVIACFFLALGVAFVARGLLVSVTGDDRSPLPVNIEQVTPVPEAVQALSQTQVFADLAENFTGTFTIDGIAIDTASIRDVTSANPQPGQQATLPPVTIFEPGNATLTFVPSSGAPIESFGQGVHTVVLRYWNLAEGENTARVYTWTFNVV